MPRFERAIRCLLAIQRGEPVTVYWMMDQFGISLAQAKRDMVELERVLPLMRCRLASGRSALVMLTR